MRRSDVVAGAPGRGSSTGGSYAAAPTVRRRESSLGSWQTSSRTMGAYDRFDMAAASLTRVREALSAEARAAAIGVLSALAGGLVRLPFERALDSQLAFLTFYPAVTVAAWLGGLVGGLAAVAASLVLVALVVAPVASSATVVGALVFVAAGVLISALGQQFRLSRVGAVETARRARLLADVAKVLGAPIDRNVTLDALAHAVVPAFADWCAIDLFDERLRFERALIVAPDPEKARLAYRLREDYPYTADAPAGVAWVARTGETEAMLGIPDGFFAQIPDEGLRQVMEGLALTSYISVPMRVPDGRTIGVLSVVMAQSGRHFTQADVELAEDLARRAAVAIDHADLLRGARARRDELESVIAQIADGVLLVDGEGRVAVQNEAALRMLGDVTGHQLDAVIDGLGRVPGPGDLRSTPSGRYVVPRLVSAETGDPPARFAMLVDRTEVVETEAARDTFVSMLSHELRTPITTIYGSAHLLRRDPAPAVRRELLDELAGETDRLYQLVEDLLVLSRYERGRLEAALEPVLIGHVVTEAVRTEAAQHPGMRIDLELGDPLPTVLADPTYLRQIVRNLVSNAAKYAGPEAHLTVRGTATEDRARLEFADDGPGIAPETAERVFELFERLPGDEMKPGAGIGLFVSRQLATLMGGRLALEPVRPHGARFVLELVAAPADAEMDVPARHDDPAPGGVAGRSTG
jgi:signal transduction histidine kinase